MSAHLRWEESNRVLGKELENIWKAGEMIDVTLVCEDRKQISAHKVVLAAYSTFFRDIFNNNPHPKPLIFLKGITHDYLLRILNFLYTGEARVSQNNLKEFLEVAEDLKIKGLIEEKKPNVKLVEETNTWPLMDTSEGEQDCIKSEVPENTEDENEFVDEHVDQTPYDGSDDLLCTICELKLKNRKSFRNHMVCKHNYPKHKPTEYKCEVCNKVFTIRRLFNRCKHEPLNQSEDVIEPQDAIEHPDVPNEKNEMVLSLPF
eukprot:GFUD01010654.1.p1 GENE.GFUD01010654.1~~GFUD01010654.1.p1  ORF type:complete len:260 (+),score=41.94 GFUD01010654.1:91-870(+)